MAGKFVSVKSKPFRWVFNLLCWESVFAVAYETWMGPGYLGALAGELKIGLSAVSLLVAIPYIGATGQILGAWAFENCHSVKRYVLGLATLGRALWLVPLFYAIYHGLQLHFHQTPFPTNTWLLIASVCACLASLLTSASANAWMYWMKKIVPAKFQGRFFGVRKRYTTTAFVFASFIAATVIGFRYEGLRIGPALICLIALTFGAISIFLHSKVANVPYLREQGPRSLKAIVKAPLQDQEFRKLLWFGAAFHGSMQLACSYFPYYFTKELNFSIGQVAMWDGIANIGCFLAATYWGKKVDQGESPFSILWTAGHVVAFAPLIYLIKDPQLIRYIAPLEYFVNGMVWSGFLLAQTKLLFRLSPPGQGAAYFSVFAAACGLSGALFSFIGGQIAQLSMAFGGFSLLWICATLARTGSLWFFCRPVLQEEKKEELLTEIYTPSVSNG